MVDLMRRPGAFDVEPRETASEITSTIDADPSAAGPHPAGTLPLLPTSEISRPSEDAGSPVISQDLPQSFCSQCGHQMISTRGYVFEPLCTRPTTCFGGTAVAESTRLCGWSGVGIVPFSSMNFDRTAFCVFGMNPTCWPRTQTCTAFRSYLLPGSRTRTHGSSGGISFRIALAGMPSFSRNC